MGPRPLHDPSGRGRLRTLILTPFHSAAPVTAPGTWCRHGSITTVDDAVAAAREAIRRLEAANLVLPRGRELHLAVGIGYGDVLNIGDHDVFGGEVNLAGKLGEDLAERGEILLSAAARQGLEIDPTGVAQVEVSISGLDLTYFRVAA